LGFLTFTAEKKEARLMTSAIGNFRIKCRFAEIDINDNSIMKKYCYIMSRCVIFLYNLGVALGDTRFIIE